MPNDCTAPTPYVVLPHDVQSPWFGYPLQPMNAGSIRSKQSKPRGLSKKTSGKSRGKLSQQQLSGSDFERARATSRRQREQRKQSKLVPLEPIAHLRSRELASYCAGASASHVSGERPVASIRVPLDGSYVVRYYRVDLASDNKLFRAGTRINAQDYERVVMNKMWMEVTPGLGGTNNGWHAIGFVADARLEVPAGSSSGNGTKKQAVLPRTIAELEVLTYFQAEKLNKTLKVSVDGLWLHRTANYAPYLVPGDDEDHPIEMVSPGWFVYIVGGYSPAFGAPVETLPPMRITSKYNIVLIDPAPRDQAAEEITTNLTAKPGQALTPVALPVARMVAGAIAHDLSIAARAASGYNFPQVVADEAIIAQAEANSGLAHRASDNDLALWPNYARLLTMLLPIASNLATVPITRLSQLYYNLRIGSASRSGKSRDVQTASYKKSIQKCDIRYSVSNPAIAGGAAATFSDTPGTAGVSVQVNKVVWCAATDVSVAVWPTDYVQAWTSATNVLSDLGTGVLVPQNQEFPVPTSVLHSVNQGSDLIRTDTTWCFFGDNLTDGSNVANAQPGTYIIRPPTAYVDPSAQRQATTINVSTPATVALRSMSYGCREGDVIQTFIGLRSYLASGGGAVPDPYTTDDLGVFYYDDETYVSNDGKKYSKATDLFG